MDGRFHAAAWAIFIALGAGRPGRPHRPDDQQHLRFRGAVRLPGRPGVLRGGPALLVYLWALKPYHQFGWVAAFLFVVCGALRLARFNVQQGSMDPRYFNGLPIPAAAMLVATSVAFYYEIGEWAPEKHIYILVTIYVLSFLMVSNVKYISFKKVEMFRRHPFHTLVGLVLVFVVIAAAPEIMGFIAMVIYVSSGVISTFIYYRRPAPGPDGEGGRTPESEAFQSVKHYQI